MLCQQCRRERGTERQAARVLNKRLSNAVQLARQPDDAAALLARARATAEFAEDSGEGDLDRGIAAARRVPADVGGPEGDARRGGAGALRERSADRRALARPTVSGPLSSR
jgi:hypothetical protein